VTIIVGTSSWSDPGFVEYWYPKGLAPKDRLDFYAERFDAVELNSSFYAIPAISTVEGWAKRTPERFTFDVKLHRLLSHHAAQLKELPADLRDEVETSERGRVLLDRPGDPRAGIAGASYGGGIALLAAAYDHRIDAIVPQITWNNLATALFPDAAGGGPRRGVFKKQWAGLLFTQGSVGFRARAGQRGPGQAGSPAVTASRSSRCWRMLCRIRAGE